MERDTDHGETTFIKSIIKRVGVSVNQHSEQYLPEGIPHESGCNLEEIACKKQSYISFRLMDINEQISHNFGHWLLCGLTLGLA
jgi:hypothetical protein